MSHAPREVTELATLPAGQLGDFFALLAHKEAGTTREGKAFFNLRFEAKGRVVAMAVWHDSPWHTTCRDSWQPGHWFKIRGLWREHPRYGPKLEATLIRAVNDNDRDDGFDPQVLSGKPQVDVEAVFAEIFALADSITHPGLRALVSALLTEHANALKRLPASRGRFHVHPGGWLEHTLGVARKTDILIGEIHRSHRLATERVDRDLALAGALLHEIGRVREWQPTDAASIVPPEPSEEGQLFGPNLLARDMVREKAASIGTLDAARLLALEHLLLSFLERPEWGSPRLPAIPEALVVHHADDLDAKMEMYLRHMSESPGQGPFTQPDPVLKRVLWRDRAFPAVKSDEEV